MCDKIRCSWLGSLFFLLMIFSRNGISRVFGFSTAVVALWIGLLVDAMLKGVKYCLFDTTKKHGLYPS